MSKFKRERYEKRLFRILSNAGYTPKQVMKINIEDILEIEGITIPNVRSILFLQSKLAGVNLNNENEQKLYHLKQRKCGRK